MIFKALKNKVIICGFCVLFYPVVFAGQAESVAEDDSDQQIGDFSLAGYGERGKKTWDLSGKTADIFEDTVKLKDLSGNLYGEKENVRLTAKEGDFDRANGKIHVEKDVVITTSGGAQLTTDSLDWDRLNSVVSTQDVVNITRKNMFTRARGARGEPGLNKMNLQEEVLLEITPQSSSGKQKTDGSNKIIITCDGPLEIDYAKNVAVFNNNVKVDRQDSQIYSDTMEVYFDSAQTGQSQEADSSDEAMLSSTKIDKIIAKGNVKTVRGENITYSQEATYFGKDNKVILSGRPKLLIYSTQDFQDLPK